MLVRRGVGEYPGYYCYDAARPSWLPYFIDDITESKCKYTPSTIAGNIAACAAGSVSCGTPSPAQQSPDLSGPGVAPAGTPSNTPNCGTFQSFNPSTAQCEIDLGAPSSLLYILGGLAVFAFFFGSGRRR